MKNSLLPLNQLGYKVDIEAIYKAYPRHVAKKAALKAIKKALKEVDYETLLAKVKQYAKAISWQEKRFIPHPATWFNQGRWEDDPSEWQEPESHKDKDIPPLYYDQHPMSPEDIERVRNTPGPNQIYEEFMANES